MNANRAVDKESLDEGISSKADTEECEAPGSAPVLYVVIVHYYSI
jgi:hypothetical protein